MKKVIMISLVFLSLLLQGCDSKEEKIKQEQIKQEQIKQEQIKQEEKKLEKIKEEGIKQDIVLIFNCSNFSSGYQNYGYYITNTGNKITYDVSEESQELLDKDKLYEYLMENLDASTGEPFMTEDDLNKSYLYLYDIDPNAEVEEIRDPNIVDSGENMLYGVQLSKEGKVTIILINGVGDYNYVNHDKHAKKIVDILNEYYY